MAVKPITPKEAVGLKKELLPDEVLEAFNELIAENIRDGEATFKATDVAARIKKKLQVKSIDAVFDKGHMDVEDIYRKAGWKVEYDRPGYCESYAATYTFTSKSRREHGQD